MKISINSPSYKKPSGVDVLGWLPFCKTWVSPDEFDSYKKNYPKADIVKCPAGIQGNGKPRVMNYILDLEFKKGNAVCFIDDDITFIGYWEGNKRYNLTTDEFMPWLEKYTYLAIECGAKLWGVNLNSDKQSYSEFTPFSFLSPVLGPFQVALPSPVRHDEKLVLKHDYDYSIRHLNKYRKILRLNKYHYDLKMAGSGTGGIGGSSTFRNLKREMQELDILQKRWGSKIVKYDFNPRSHNLKKIRSFDINPRIWIPIRGL